MTRIVAAAIAALGVASVSSGFGAQPYAANALRLKTRMLGTPLDDKEIKKALKEDRVLDGAALQERRVGEVEDGAIQAEEHPRNWIEEVCYAAQECLKNWTQEQEFPFSSEPSADGVLNDYLYNAETAMPYYEKRERLIAGGKLPQARKTAWAALWLRYAFKHTKYVLGDGASWEHQTNHKYEDYVTGDEIVEANNYIDDLLKKRDTLQKLDDGHEELQRTDPANLKNFVLQGGGATWVDGEGYHKAGKPLFDLLTLKTGNGEEVLKVKDRLEKEVRELEQEEKSRTDQRKLGRTSRTRLILELIFGKETSTVFEETLENMKMEDGSVKVEFQKRLEK